MATDLLSDIVNNPLFSWLIISVIFWAIIIGLVYLLRNNRDAINVFFPFLAMMRTKKLNKFIARVGRTYPKFWRIFWTIGIFISFGIMIFAYYFFFTNVISLIFDPKIENVITPLIPGVTVPLPLFAEFLLPILFVMTTHEFAHGIASSTDDVEVKSTGVMGAGIFFLIGFGAFVEVDERELNSSKHTKNTRLRIAAAGTYINGVTALIVLFVIIFYPTLISPFYGKQVVQIDSVISQNEGGYNYNVLEAEDVIESLKKKGDTNFIDLDYDQGITLSGLLYNQTSLIICSVGDNLTLNIYLPSQDKNVNKEIILCPRYTLGIIYE